MIASGFIALAGLALALHGAWNVNRATTPGRAYCGMFQLVVGGLIAVILGAVVAMTAARADGVVWHWCKYAPGYHTTDWWERCRGTTETTEKQITE